MDSISFQCEGCGRGLRAPADKAGRKVRCTGCGTVLAVPERPVSKANVEPATNEETTDSDLRQERSDEPGETEGKVEARPTQRRKRRRGVARSTDPRTDSAWRKVRLGLILIALSMCIFVPLKFVGGVTWLLSLVGITFNPLAWVPLQRAVQALPIVGNLLCAFVPLKGAARILIVANLGVIALGLAMTLVAGRMGQRGPDKLLADNLELTKKATASISEERELSKQIDDLRRKSAAGNKDAATDERELSKKLTELQYKRIAEMQKDSERALAELKNFSSRSLAGFMGFWGWVHIQGHVLSTSIQIIILSFFVRAIALALGDKEFAVTCPRVAAIALVTLILNMLHWTLPMSYDSLVFRLLNWIDWILSMVSYVWQGILLVEACRLIDNHISRKST